MAVSKAQMQATKRFEDINYDKILVRLSKGSKQHIQTVAAENGESVNAYIVGAVNDRLKSEGHSELPTKATSEQECNNG
ncbi:MAG: Arc family DNA-binding protein [Oscillospiraceae bacterium]|nr:Arc family DNA-binding protein [Oscillospiraceae bacterium]